MTYTCAVFPTPESTLEEAQFEKYDLIARKLDLQPGQRLLDIGCGWGGMVRHAAKHYGVKVIGVTLSQEQATWAQDEIKRQGLDHLAEVRFMDYRDVTETDFDAISSIGLTEHIGVRNYASYFTFLHDHLKIGGRCSTTASRGRTTRRCRPVRSSTVTSSRTASSPASAASPSRRRMPASRCATSRTCVSTTRLTLKAGATTSSSTGTRRSSEVSLGRAKVWGIYMAGSRLAFERNEIELHHVLAVKTDAHGQCGLAAAPDLGQLISGPVSRGR